MKKPSHRRSDKERKEKITSIRLSDEQHKKIQANADEAHMSFSNYMVTSAVNCNSLTPALMVEIQDNINYACAAVEEHAPEKVKTMQEGVNKLWQKLM